MAAPTVSILMSVYDGDNPVFVKQAIDSIRTQTWQDLECVLVLDGVKRADILQVVHQYSEADKRVRVVRLANNVGLAAAMNKAIATSTGKYLIRMDADDRSEPDRVRKLVNFLEGHPDISFVGSFESVVNSRGEDIGVFCVPTSWPQMVRTMIWRTPIAHASTAFRREFFDRIKGYREDLRRDQDIDLWFRALREGLLGANVPEYLYVVRRGGNWTERKANFQAALSEFKLRWTYVRPPHFPFWAMAVAPCLFLAKLLPKPVFRNLYQYVYMRIHRRLAAVEAR